MIITLIAKYDKFAYTVINYGHYNQKIYKENIGY